MGSERFLITGASGRTGGETARYLLERGYPVRAFVHQEDERSAQLQARGAEIVVGDLHDFMTVRQALEGVAERTSCIRTTQESWRRPPTLHKPRKKRMCQPL